MEMKAKANCPKCEKELSCDCRACIENEEALHDCQCKDNSKITKKVKWSIC